MPAKIKVDNPVVDLDGDEMTRCAVAASRDSAAKLSHLPNTRHLAH